MKKNKALFYKFLIPYLTLLLVPLFLVTNIAFTKNISSLKEEILLNHRMQVENVMHQLILEMEDLMHITLQISTLPDFSNSRIKGNTYAQRMAVKLLKRYIMPNGIIEEIFLFYRGEDRVIGGESTYSRQMLFDLLYSFESFDIKGQLEKAESGEKSFLIMPSDRVSILSLDSKLLIPVAIKPNIRENQGITYLFLLRASALESYLEPLLTPYEGKVGISLITGESLVSLQNSQVSDLVGSGDFSSYTLESDYYGFRLETGISINDLYSSFERIKREIFLWIGFVLLLGSLAIFIFMRLNYKPINHFKEIAEVTFHRNFDSSDLFREIEINMLEVFQKNESLQSQLTQSQSTLKDSFIAALIQGNREEVNQYIKEEGSLAFKPFDCYIRLIHIEIMDNRSSIAYENILSDLESLGKNDLKFYVRWGFFKNQLIAVLIGTDSVVENSNIVDNIQEVFNSNSLSCVTGLSSVYKGLEHAPRAYLESNEAINYAAIGDYNHFYFDQIPNPQQESPYPNAILEQLELCLLNGKGELTESSVENLKKCIVSGVFTTKTIGALRYELVRLLIRIIKERSLDDYDTMSIYNLTNNDSLKTFFSGYCLEAVKITRLVGKQRESLSDRNHLNLQKYIEQNYDNPNFSLQIMADSFGMTESNLSHKYKNFFGKTAAGYIRELRMNSAKKLLTGTDLPLSRIVSKIGYYNTSSFVRTFKQEFKVTPGEFRKLNRNESDNPSPS